MVPPNSVCGALQYRTIPVAGIQRSIPYTYYPGPEVRVGMAIRERIEHLSRVNVVRRRRPIEVVIQECNHLGIESPTCTWWSMPTTGIRAGSGHV